MLLFGPTGVGKTGLLAEQLRGEAEVVNADSLQIYRGMDIGTGKPDLPTRAALPHHLIDILDPNEGFSVGAFVEAADRLVPEILSRGKIPVVSGGSAFYLKHFLLGLPGTPPVDPAIRDELSRAVERRGARALHAELEEADPEAARRIAPGDRYRIVRALEIVRSAGRPLSRYAPPGEPRTRYDFLVLGLERARAELYRRIDERVADMFARGLLAEVGALVEAGYGFRDPGMRGIGYREFAATLGAEPPREPEGAELASLRELVARNSRRYAKRQITFFRSLPLVRWVEADDGRTVREEIVRFIGSRRR